MNADWKGRYWVYLGHKRLVQIHEEFLGNHLGAERRKEMKMKMKMEMKCRSGKWKSGGNEQCRERDDRKIETWDPRSSLCAQERELEKDVMYYSAEWERNFNLHFIFTLPSLLAVNAFSLRIENYSDFPSPVSTIANASSFFLNIHTINRNKIQITKIINSKIF